jgi:hypothetical protein
MANPTTNFGWVMPTSTDVVTDLPADFAVFGQGVDTSMADLKGGTTGQILSKASNTDMDFTWTAANPGDITGVTAGTGISGGGTSGDVTVTNSMATAIDAKGDLIAGTAADTFARLAVGTNGQTLVADSTASTGLKWASPTSKVVQIVTSTYSTETTNSTTTFADTGLTATITPTSASNQILAFVSQNGVSRTASASGSAVGVKLLRGATTIVTFSNQAGYTGTAVASNVGTVGGEYLDSPATTSATIYKTQFKNATAASAAVVQEYNITSTIVLMEVTP